MLEGMSRRVFDLIYKELEEYSPKFVSSKPNKVKCSICGKKHKVGEYTLYLDERANKYIKVLEETEKYTYEKYICPKCSETHKKLLEEKEMIKTKMQIIPYYDFDDVERKERVYMGGTYLHGKLEKDCNYDIYEILVASVPEEIKIVRDYFGSHCGESDSKILVKEEEFLKANPDFTTLDITRGIYEMQYNGKPCIGYFWGTKKPVYIKETGEYVGDEHRHRGLVVYADDEEANKYAKELMASKPEFF